MNAKKKDYELFAQKLGDDFHIVAFEEYWKAMQEGYAHDTNKIKKLAYEAHENKKMIENA